MAPSCPNCPELAEWLATERAEREAERSSARETILALVAHLLNAPAPRPESPRGLYALWWEATQTMVDPYRQAIPPRRIEIPENE